MPMIQVPFAVLNMKLSRCYNPVHNSVIWMITGMLNGGPFYQDSRTDIVLNVVMGTFMMIWVFIKTNTVHTNDKNVIFFSR